MIFYWEEQKRKQYRVASLHSGWTKACAKHYPVWTAKVFEEAEPSKFYFLKFTKLDEGLLSKQACEDARRRFQNEGRFQVRHPSIEYVFGSGEGRLLFEKGDRAFLKKQDLKLDEIESQQMRAQLEVLSKQSQGVFGDCYRYLEQKDGEILFLLTEYVEGSSLQEYYETDAFDVNQAENQKQMFFHMRQAISAMDAYRNQNRIDSMLIRDITPANYMITEKEHHLKYIDFDWSYTGSEAGKSKKGAIGGTPGYLDPRQAQSDMKTSDIQMDIYAMGMVFLYMIMGEDYIFSLPQVMELEDEIDYLRSRTLPYTLFRNRIRRDGRLVLQEPQFDVLFSIIGKMIAPVPQRYQSPAQIQKDFDDFLESIYPKRGEEFRNPLLLSSKKPGKKTCCICAVKNMETGRKTVQNYMVEENMLIDIVENKVLVYYFRDKLYRIQLNLKTRQTAERVEITEKPVRMEVDSLQITLKRVHIGTYS